jgi:hypothetical protein
MSEMKPYTLDVDGPLFRAQRELLLRITDHAQRKQPYVPTPGDEELLEGLIGLTDSIADQARDRYGIECLICEDEEDENRGAVPG